MADGYARSRFLSISLIFQFTKNCKGRGAPKCANPAAIAEVRETPYPFEASDLSESAVICFCISATFRPASLARSTLPVSSSM